MVSQGPPYGGFASRFSLLASRFSLLASRFSLLASRFPLPAYRFSLWLLRAGARALPRGPWGAARLGRPARRGAGRDAGDVRDSAGMHCPRTPAETREPSAQGCAEGADEGWPFFWFLFFGHAKKRDSGSPKGWPKALALRFKQRSEHAKPGRVWSSWWARAHPMTAARSGSPKGWPKALALRCERQSDKTTPRRVGSSWWARAHPMTAAARQSAGPTERA